MDPFHAFRQRFFKTGFNIAFASTSWSSKVVSLYVFQLQSCMHFTSVQNVLSALPSHPSLFHHPNNIGYDDEYSLVFWTWSLKTQRAIGLDEFNNRDEKLKGRVG
jgi:hypothetical protein